MMMSSQELQELSKDTTGNELHFEDGMILKVPSLSSINSQTKSERRGSTDGKLLRVPTISRRRNSLLIHPVLSIANGGANNNGLGENDKPKETQAHRDSGKIQSSKFGDFLRYEKELHGECEATREGYAEVYNDLNGTEMEDNGFSMKRMKSLAAACCVCKIPGVKEDEYLAQGHTCFRCCLIQGILIILHIPALIIASIKAAIDGCQKCSKRPDEDSGDEDDDDDIELKDFDHFWIPRDITDDEKDNYRDKVASAVKDWELNKTNASLELIQDECRLVCKNNFMKRFQIILKMLQTNFQELVELGVELARLAAKHGHEEIVKILIKSIEGGGNIKTNRNRVGVSTLHMVIINSQRELLNLILEQFSPDDQYVLLHTHTPATITRWFAALELPLNLAVWIGDEGILEDMVNRGAEMCEQDKDGHNVFHITVLLADENPELACKMFDKLEEMALVWVNKSRKFTFFRSMSIKSARIISMEMLLHAQNTDEYTPLQLAAKHGQHMIMDKILNICDVYKFTKNNLGPKSHTYYDMTEIDPFLMQSEKTASVLELAVMRQGDSAIECLGLEPISRLIEEKCDHYWAFISTNAFCHFCFMILYNVSTYRELLPHMHPNDSYLNDPNRTDEEFEQYMTERFHIGLVDIFIVVMAILYFIYGVLAICATWNLAAKIKASVTDRILMSNTLQLQTLLLFSSLAIVYILLKASKTNGEVYALAFSMLTGWLHIILYTRAFKATAFFAIMINKILFTDVLRFLCVIFIIVVGYSMSTTAVFFVLDSDQEMYTDPFVVMVQYLKLAIGISDFSALIEPPYNVASVILYVTFLVIANVLLFNLLIAAMSTTFAKISEQRELLCHKVRISDILVLEQMLPLFLQSGCLDMYKHKTSKLHMPGGTIFEKEMYLIQAKGKSYK